MEQDEQAFRSDIRNALIGIAERVGEDASVIQDDELIPATGLIDSAGLLELLTWFEAHFAISIPQEEVTIDNLGSIALMADFALRKKQEQSGTETPGRS